VLQKQLILYLVALALLTACGMNITNENLSSTPEFVTATLALISTPLRAETPVPPSALATTPPIEGITTAQINVRSEPSTAGNNLGTIAPFSTVQILGKESYGAWYQIVYSGSPSGNGWITAAYVQVNTNVEFPVIETGTGSGSGVSGLVIQPINVRSGPGTGFESLGTLSPNDVVTVSGKDPSGAWMQIVFKSGIGWVTSEFMKVNDKDALPVTVDTTQIVATASTPEAVIDGPALVPAWLDGDSLQAPSASVTLSLSGTRAFEFAGEISSPEGDSEDWVQFASPSKLIQASLKCSSNDASMDLWKNGSIVQNLKCNNDQVIEVLPGDIYSGQFHIMEPGITRFVTYRLKVEILP
jgi:uncharacterized protein YraI